jgi:hypothetical protein
VTSFCYSVVFSSLLALFRGAEYSKVKFINFSFFSCVALQIDLFFHVDIEEHFNRHFDEKDNIKFVQTLNH